MKISVVFPVYNVQSYIYNSLKSILNQTFKSIEIIVVNDCSLDKSIDIIKEFKDPRIKIINNKRNYGLAESRTIGLRSACGDIVYFMDSDDEVRPNLFENVVSQFKNNRNIDMVCFNFERVSDQIDTNVLTCARLDKTERLNSDESLIKLMDGGISTTSWSYMSKLEFLRKINLTFTPNRLFEDMNTSSFLLSKAENVRLIHFTPSPYLYLQRKDSIMGKNKKIPGPKEIDDNFFMITAEYKIFREKLNNNERVDRWFLNMLLYYYEFYYSRTKKSDLLKEYYQEIYRLQRSGINLNLKEKLKLIMVKFPILFLLKNRRVCL